ncbi:MAG: NAD+ synthase, partial [Acidobacteria bacterium]|nr:NAD+ synthase [Acidobacteriota bacterium]
MGTPPTPPSLRVALVQLNPLIGDFDGNVAAMARAYAQAEAAGCDAAVFGELSVAGYPPEDLVLRSGFAAENLAAITAFAAGTGRCAAVAGYVAAERGRLYNAAAVCAGGAVVGTYRKQRLPNYRVFDEERYFEPGSSFDTFVIGGVEAGVAICEDIWVDDGPLGDMVAAGARIILNPNGSPYHRGRLADRTALVSGLAARTGCPIVYVNLVGGQDELVFDGGSMVVDATGAVVARAAQYEEEVLVVDIPLRSSSQGDSTSARRPQPVVVSGAAERAPLAMPAVAPPLDPLDEVAGALVLGIRDYVRKNGFTDVVIGLSGGVDSALVAALAVEALGARHVHGVSMPSRYSSDGSRTDAGLLAANLAIDIQPVPIEPAFASYLSMLEPAFAGRAHDLTEENLQSRIRGTILMAMSNKFGWLVLTTGNKSEVATGYFTLYGDSAGGFAPIKDVLKTDVWALCRHLNRRAGRELIPAAIIDKPPSAELRPDQRDDQSLPPYEVLDPILRLYVEEDLAIADVVARGHDEALVRRIARLVDVSEHKRRQGPPGVRISVKA